MLCRSHSNNIRIISTTKLGIGGAGGLLRTLFRCHSLFYWELIGKNHQKWTKKRLIRANFFKTAMVLVLISQTANDGIREIPRNAMNPILKKSFNTLIYMIIVEATRSTGESLTN